MFLKSFSHLTSPKLIYFAYLQYHKIESVYIFSRIIFITMYYFIFQKNVNQIKKIEGFTMKSNYLFPAPTAEPAENNDAPLKFFKQMILKK